MIEILAPEFHLSVTLNSGQVFHWEKVGEGFVGTIGDLPAYVEQKGAVLRAKVASGCRRHSGKDAQGAHATIKYYFALDHPLTKICASFPNEPVLNAAREFCHGLRIIRQPKWECLATFICSSMKQVAHIRQISKALRERFGLRREIGRCTAYTFPSAQRLAESSERDLQKCALGYRAKNLLATSRLVASSKTDLEAWSTLSDFDLCKKLCKLPGVGPKVANCVMLFAYERLRAFPIDVWVERVLRQQYFPRARRLNTQRLRNFCENHFGDHGGYAQQYLFHYARMVLGKSGAPRDSLIPKGFGTSE